MNTRLVSTLCLMGWIIGSDSSMAMLTPSEIQLLFTSFQVGKLPCAFVPSSHGVFEA